MKDFRIGVHNNMAKTGNDFAFAWEVIIILFLSKITERLLFIPLKNLIINSLFLTVTYSLIPTLLILTYIFLKRRKILSCLSFKIETEHWDRYFWFLAISAGFFLLPILLSNAKISSIVLYIQRQLLATNNFSYMFYFIEILFAPITEEIIFRGIVLSGFLTLYPPKKSILLSSLVFSLLHFNVSQFISAFIIGLLLGWYYYKTSNLLSCIIIHSLNNLIRVLALDFAANKFSHFDVTSETRLFPNDSVWILVLTASALLFLGLYYLYVSFKKNPDQPKI